LDISFECGVLPLLMGPLRPPGHALFEIHSNTGEREKINTLITYILQQVPVLICRRCAFAGE
jgi:hypothetical protein